jgi:hypothetical protein
LWRRRRLSLVANPTTHGGREQVIVISNVSGGKQTLRMSEVRTNFLNTDCLFNTTVADEEFMVEV